MVVGLDVDMVGGNGVEATGEEGKDSVGARERETLRYWDTTKVHH